MNPRVLYIGGTGRTGSTVLDSLLAAFPHVFSGGELASVWSYGLTSNGKCSCGQTLDCCPTWSAVLAQLASVTDIDPERMVELRRRFWSIHLPLMPSKWVRERKLRRLEEFPTVVEQLYHAISDTTGAQLIVDSSKEPHYSYILRERTDLDMYFLQLVRDPRAVGMSWRRTRVEPGFDGGVNMDKRGSIRASIYYDVSNIAAEALWRRTDRYAFMRYEDFVSRPHEAVRQISDFVGVEMVVDDVLDDTNSFQRTDQHTAWGNPNRFEHGRTTLRPDSSWLDELPRRSELALKGCTAPLMYRYGYPSKRTRLLHPPRSQDLRDSQIGAT